MNHPTASLRDDLKHGGYSLEEEYFYRANKDLIDERRRELDRRRAALGRESDKGLHWMKCPKCGQGMIEMNFAKILIDQCSSCRGVYMDRGELETLLRAQTRGRFWKHLGATFLKGLEKGDTNWAP